MALASLPHELWELICSYLPDDEVLRLLSLNSTFLCCALVIRYGTFSIQPCSNLKAHLQHLRSPYVSGKVHTLRLSNDADQITYGSSTTGMLPAFALAQLRKWKRKSIVDSIRRLDGVYRLIMNYGEPNSISSTHSYMDFAWKTFSQSLVVLDLRLQATGLRHFACVDPSLVCDHIRILKLGVNPSPNMDISPILGTEQVLFDNAIQRLSALLAPSPLVEVVFTQSHLKLHVRRAPPLSSFTKLKKIVFHSSNSCPFHVVPLIHSNLGTLEELGLYQSPYTWQPPLDWSTATLLGPNLRKIVLHIGMFSSHLTAILSQLANCHRLESFELVDCHPMLPNIFGSERYQHIYRKPLETLSMNCPCLTRLAIPFVHLNPPFFLRVIAALPNLESLTLRGETSVITDKLTKDFLDRFPNMDPNSPWVELVFENLAVALSSADPESEYPHEDIINCLLRCGTLVLSTNWPFYPVPRRHPVQTCFCT